MFDEIDKAYLRTKLRHYRERLGDLDGRPEAALYERLASTVETELRLLEQPAEPGACLNA